MWNLGTDVSRAGQGQVVNAVMLVVERGPGRLAMAGVPTNTLCRKTTRTCRIIRPAMTAEPPKVQIYVRLLDEGTEVWRPVSAAQAGDAYLLEGPVPEGELLEFPVGTLVRCQPRKFQDAQQTQLVAVSAALQWGDSVIVKLGARPAWRPGARAEVCGVRQVETPSVAAAFGVQVGAQLLLIEFSDGSSAEVPEATLDRAESPPSRQEVR